VGILQSPEANYKASTSKEEENAKRIQLYSADFNFIPVYPDRYRGQQVYFTAGGNCYRPDSSLTVIMPSDVIWRSFAGEFKEQRKTPELALCKYIHETATIFLEFILFIIL
jgi:hypothetical protein